MAEISSHPCSDHKKQRAGTVCHGSQSLSDSKSSMEEVEYTEPELNLHLKLSESNHMSYFYALHTSFISYMLSNREGEYNRYTKANNDIWAKSAYLK